MSADAPAEPFANLGSALDHFEIDLSPETVERLERYAATLWEANRVMNLTRHTNFEKFVARDIVDSLQLASLLAPSQRVLDMGSGGGVPGAILKIVRDDLEVVLSESVGKKAQALTEIVARAELNVSVHMGRAEQLLSCERFHCVTARAVAPLSKILKWCAGCWHQMDRLLLIKGRNWVQERGEARHLGLMTDLELRRVASYLNPDSGAESVILEIRAEE